MSIFKKLFTRNSEQPKKKKNKPAQSIFSTDLISSTPRHILLKHLESIAFQKSGEEFVDTANGVAMDSASSIKSHFNLSNSNVLDAQLSWYVSQGFVGYQIAALLSQHWLINKACLMPAQDAVRNGYEATINDGTKVDEEVLDAIRKAKTKYKIDKNLVELEHQGRIFGIRIAKFIIDSDDPEYYAKPFNPDGITPGSYKGISQIDPFWITPLLDADASANPASMHFYEPTWWVVNGERIHRTHLVIMRTCTLPDILKPTYLYGGIPLPQQICERVYAAERTANEAPLLALTKRSKTLHTDLTQAIANPHKFENRIERMAQLQNNYGVSVVGKDDVVEQFDTSLTDLDAVIMTQYQIVAAAAEVPAVKLLGTSPKGFNATGEFEEKSYHEKLESIQAHDLTPLLDRHHLLLIRSEIVPKFGIDPFSVSVEWNPLSSVSAEGLAVLNKTKAETDAILVTSGAIDGFDVRQRLISDPASGYSGMEQTEDPTVETSESDPDAEDITI